MSWMWNKRNTAVRPSRLDLWSETRTQTLFADGGGRAGWPCVWYQLGEGATWPINGYWQVWHREGLGCGCKICKKNYPYGCKNFKKWHLWVQNLRNLTFYSSHFYIFFFKMPPLWVQKSVKPYPSGCFQGLLYHCLWVQKSVKPYTLLGAFRACKTPSLWMQFFLKQGLSYPGAHLRRPEVLSVCLPVDIHISINLIQEVFETIITW